MVFNPIVRQPQKNPPRAPSVQHVPSRGAQLPQQVSASTIPATSNYAAAVSPGNVASIPSSPLSARQFGDVASPSSMGSYLLDAEGPRYNRTISFSDRDKPQGDYQLLVTDGGSVTFYVRDTKEERRVEIALFPDLSKISAVVTMPGQNPRIVDRVLPSLPRGSTLEFYNNQTGHFLDRVTIEGNPGQKPAIARGAEEHSGEVRVPEQLWPGDYPLGGNAFRYLNPVGVLHVKSSGTQRSVELDWNYKGQLIDHRGHEIGVFSPGTQVEIPEEGGKVIVRKQDSEELVDTFNFKPAKAVSLPKTDIDPKTHPHGKYLDLKPNKAGVVEIIRPRGIDYERWFLGEPSEFNRHFFGMIENDTHGEPTFKPATGDKAFLVDTKTGATNAIPSTGYGFNLIRPGQEIRILKPGWDRVIILRVVN